MATLTRQAVEKAEINVDELVELLVKNATADPTTFYYYIRDAADQPGWDSGESDQGDSGNDADLRSQSF